MEREIRTIKQVAFYLRIIQKLFMNWLTQESCPASRWEDHGGSKELISSSGLMRKKSYGQRM